MQLVQDAHMHTLYLSIFCQKYNSFLDTSVACGVQVVLERLAELDKIET